MKVLEVQQPSQFQFMIFCPACRCGHGLRVGQPQEPNWGFNGDMERPTFTPSLLTWGVRAPDKDPETGDWKRGPDGEYLKDEQGRLLGAQDWCCHSFITDGKISYCMDSTHELRGQTVELPDF